MVLDCDLGLEGVQGQCDVPAGRGTVDVGVVLVNRSDVARRLGAFNFVVRDSDTSRLLPLPGVDGNLNGNPDVSAGLAGDGFHCDLPAPNPDNGADGPGRARSRAPTPRGCAGTRRLGRPRTLPPVVPVFDFLLGVVPSAAPRGHRVGDEEARNDARDNVRVLPYPVGKGSEYDEERRS